MNPSPIFRHQRTLLGVVRLLDDACPAGNCAVTEWAWKPGDDEFSPDVITVCPSDLLA